MAHDGRGESPWPEPDSVEIERITVPIGALSIVIEGARDFERLLDFYAREHAGDTDLIPYHGVLWPSGLALAKYLDRRFPSLAGVRVVELGCGLGLPSVVAALKGARVLATDYHPDNERFLRRNSELNRVEIEYRALSWRDPPAGLQFDLVLASDVVYERQSPGPLTACAAGFCAPGGRIILSDPGRNHLQVAVSRFEELGFRTQFEVVGDCFVIECSKEAGPPG
jgi:predicted nicotinamide N-methyase